MLQYKGKFVCLDLETTGLDSEKDDIIEIAAVTYNKGKKEGEFHTLVNPQRKLPFIAHAITHISDSDLEKAPLFKDVKKDLEGFIGDYPILGQNIAFDIKFLRAKGIPVENTPLDTRILAAMVLPKVPALNLEALALYFRFPYEHAHRALADVYMTINVFDRLYQRLCTVSPQFFSDIEDIAKEKSWQFADVFARAAKKATQAPRRDHPAQTTFPLSGKKNARLISSDKSTVARVGELLSQARAGTATLVDASPYRRYEWSLVQGVCASTKSTTSLVALNRVTFGQMKQELMRAPSELSSAVATLSLPMGYICPERVRLFAQKLRLSNNEMNFIVRMLLWLSHTTTGDADEINTSYEEAHLLRLVSCDEACVAGTCPSNATSSSASAPPAAKGASGCFWTRAYERAKNAPVVMVTHRFISDQGNKPISLPVGQLIIDDAHELEEEMSQAQTLRIDAHDILSIIDQLSDESKTSGVLVDLEAMSGVSKSARDKQAEIAPLVIEARNTLLLGFSMLGLVAKDTSSEQGNTQASPSASQATRVYAQQFLVDVAMHENPHWGEAMTMMARLSEKLGHLCTLLHALSNDDEKIPIQDNILQLSRLMKEKQLSLEEFLKEPDSDQSKQQRITIVTLGRMNDVSLSHAPTSIVRYLQENFYQRYTKTLLFSSVASTVDMRRFLQSRLGLASDPVVSRLFETTEYDNFVPHVMIAKDMPSPNSPRFGQQLTAFLLELISSRSAENRAHHKQLFFLSPSISLIQSMYPALFEQANKQGVPLLADGVTGSPAKIMEKAKAQKGNFILGASKFWDRRMIEACAPDVAIIPKLPFTHPQNFIAQARQSQYQNGFQEYVMPSVGAKVHQALDGIYAYTQTQDAGRHMPSIIILDPRMTQGYAHPIFDLLPQQRLEIRPLSEISTLLTTSA